MASQNKLFDNLWTEYEKSLEDLRKLEKSNTELENKNHIDTLRINFLKKEGESKLLDREECYNRIMNLNDFFSFLSEKLDEIEEILNYDTISADQVKELYKFFKDNTPTLHFSLSAPKKQGKLLS